MKKLAPGVFLWTAVHPDIEATVGSFYLDLGGIHYVIDPMEPDDEAMTVIEEHGEPEAVLLSNDAHDRACAWFRDEFNIPVWAHAATAARLPDLVDRSLSHTEVLRGDVTVVHLPGTHPGEVAWLVERGNGILILADAVLGNRSGGFRFNQPPLGQPEDPEAGKMILKRLLDLSFDTAFVSHGLPVRDDPRGQLRQLLEASELL